MWTPLDLQEFLDQRIQVQKHMKFGALQDQPGCGTLPVLKLPELAIGQIVRLLTLAP